MTTKPIPQIVVVGSHAPGLLIHVQRIPEPGETVIGWDYSEPVDGGKGSNQAIAAARLGAATSFVGCLGHDRLGAEAEKWLLAEGVDLSCLVYSAHNSTGVGFIILDEKGVPAMVTSMGANADLDNDQVDRALEAMAGARVMLTQFEIHPEVALHAARTARKLGILPVVNPAPAVEVPLEALAAAEILVPNETEAGLLLGSAPGEELAPEALATQLRQRSGVACVIITLGEKGIAGADESGTWWVSPPVVSAVDTSGAGDSFCAALAAGLTHGMSKREASAWACRVAALSVTRPGTIPAFPTLAEVESFLQVARAGE
jgi:ribokinase